MEQEMAVYNDFFSFDHWLEYFDLFEEEEVNFTSGRSHLL